MITYCRDKPAIRDKKNKIRVIVEVLFSSLTGILARWVAGQWNQLDQN